jgi:hypothetical protein
MVMDQSGVNAISVDDDGKDTMESPLLSGVWWVAVLPQPHCQSGASIMVGFIIVGGEEACYQKEWDDKKFEFPYQKDSCVLKYLIKPLARNAVFY